MTVRTIAVAVVLLGGCKSAEEKCKPARDALFKWQEKEREGHMHRLPEEELAKAEAFVAEKLPGAKEEFMTLCVALDKKGLDCVERLHTFERVNGKMEAAIAACPKEGTRPVPSCEAKARETAKKHLEGCDMLKPLVQVAISLRTAGGQEADRLPERPSPPDPAQDGDG